MDYAQQRHDSGSDGWVVQHCTAPDQAHRLVDRCRDIFGTEPEFVSELGPGHERACRSGHARAGLSADALPGLTPPGARRCAVRALIQNPRQVSANDPPATGTSVGAASPTGLSAASFMSGPAPRVVARTVLVVVAIGITLYLMYQLRRPVGWLLVATFLAVALSGPVNFLNRRMRRGAAITIVYLGILAIPFAMGSVIVPPLVKEGSNLADDAPGYARDVTDFVNENERLREINRDYDGHPEAAGPKPRSFRPSSAEPPRPCGTWGSGSSTRSSRWSRSSSSRRSCSGAGGGGSTPGCDICLSTRLNG